MVQGSGFKGLPAFGGARGEQGSGFWVCLFISYQTQNTEHQTYKKFEKLRIHQL
jgi:hypothetical protein